MANAGTNKTCSPPPCPVRERSQAQTDVQKLANVRAAAAHLLKPRQGEPSQLVVRLGKPGIDAGISPGAAREPEEMAHRASLPACGGPGALRINPDIASLIRATLGENLAQNKTAAAGNRDGCFCCEHIRQLD
jgi:hypothetical protein